ncbi:MAG: SGNH/GDSL hydrolase family protein [Myxococcota bacterium]
MVASFWVWAVGCTPDTVAPAGGPRAPVDPAATGSTADPDLPGTSTGTATTTATTGTTATTATTGTGTTSTTDPPSAIDLCFGDIADPTRPSPDYDQFHPTVGSHCSGTDHQTITAIDRVVFLGDSITVGTPPTPNAEFYRNRLAAELVTEFGLDAPGPLWERVDVLSGTTIVEHSGDFWSCATWGDRADDLLQDGTQLEDCFPEDTRDQRTLVVMTVGGNDLASLQQGFQEGVPVDQSWAETEAFMGLVREAVAWMTDPVRFPNGNAVILTNLYEYTDGTGEVTACPGAALAGYQDTTDPDLAEMVVWSMEQFMSISVDNGTDLVFLLETFCGHGYNRDDATGQCYRGPDTDLWFDLTCIHPNPTGHQVIADLFMDVVRE